jgi:hypothetical protein
MHPVVQDLTASLTAVVSLSACGAGSGGSAAPSTTRPTTAPAPTSSVPVPTQKQHSEKKWVDLQVGDCLADPPPSDPSVVTVTVVDCTTAHQAEVYLRASVGVNEATADVANDKCAAGFSPYTGAPLHGSPYATTYLIDSNQDRTSANPDPSTVLCLLHAADGRPLTESAHHS